MYLLYIFIASYYKHLSADTKTKNYNIKTSIFSPYYLYLLLLCQMRDINSMRRGGDALAPNRCNSLPYRQRSCNQRVGCLHNWDLEPLDHVKLSTCINDVI